LDDVLIGNYTSAYSAEPARNSTFTWPKDIIFSQDGLAGGPHVLKLNTSAGLFLRSIDLSTGNDDPRLVFSIARLRE
jgi:hypothetical protein